jgi:hypothetical protein
MSALEAGLGISQLRGTEPAVAEAVAKAKSSLSVTPGLALVATTIEHDASAFMAALRAELPGVPISGITTSLGILTASGIVSEAHGVVGISLLASPDGTVSFGAGSAAIQGSAREATHAAASAIKNQHPGKLPVVLLLTASPGAEEEVLAAVAEEFPNVPACGGSAADHAIAGKWSIFGTDGAHRNGVTLAALFGQVRVGAAFVSPYEVTETRAVVTEAEGRTIRTLNGRPAAEVLGEWVGPAIADQVRSGGVILAQTALSPLALRRSTGTGYYYIPSHPFQITQPGGSVSIFTKPAVGDTICLLRGSVEGLTGHLEALVDQALAAASLDVSQVKAGFLIYCAGCAGAVGGELNEALRRHLAPKLPGVPVLGLCTFGEQGFVPGLGNVHQNLSVRLVLLG